MPIAVLPNMVSLRAFEACARLGGCTLAARELFTTPGAVSKQLKALELTLGVPLFVRARQGLLLTKAGTTYLITVQAVMSQLEAAGHRVRDPGSQRTRLMLHVLPTLADKWLLPRFPAFAGAHPEIDVQFTAQLGDVVEPAEADLAFRYGLGAWPGFDASYLVGRELRLVASPALLEREGPVCTPSDVLRFTLLQHFELPTAWHEFFTHHSVPRKTVPSTVRYGFFSVLIRGALTGMGLALVPDVLVSEELRSGALVNPGGFGCVSRRGYYLLCPRHRSAEAAITSFREWVVAVAKEPGPTVLLPPVTGVDARRRRRPR